MRDANAESWATPQEIKLLRTISAQDVVTFVPCATTTSATKKFDRLVDTARPFLSRS